MPVGTPAREALRAYLEGPRAALLARAREPLRVRHAARPADVAAGLLEAAPPARARTRAARGEPAPPAPLLRDAPSRRRRGPSRRAGDARSRRHRHDADLHRRRARAAARGPSPLPSALDAPSRDGRFCADSLHSIQSRCGRPGRVLQIAHVREQLLQISLWILPILVAVIFHEVAHGYVANRLGDDTAQAGGTAHAEPAAAHRSDRQHPPAAPAARHQRRIPVRLGEAGAGRLRAAAQSQARHGVGRRGRPAHQLRARHRRARSCFAPITVGRRATGTGALFETAVLSRWR